MSEWIQNDLMRTAIVRCMAIVPTSDARSPDWPRRTELRKHNPEHGRQIEILANSATWST